MTLSIRDDHFAEPLVGQNPMCACYIGMLVDHGVLAKLHKNLIGGFKALFASKTVAQIREVFMIADRLVHKKQGMEALTGLSPTGIVGNGMPYGASRPPLFPP